MSQIPIISYFIFVYIFITICQVNQLMIDSYIIILNFHFLIIQDVICIRNSC